MELVFCLVPASISSDSDYWGLISSLPEARFLVMVEREKCSHAMKQALAESGIFYCYIDDFYSGNADGIKMSALFKEMYRYLDHSIHLNVNDMFAEALRITRLTMTEAEKRQFYDVLYEAVLERLQYWARAVQQDEEQVLRKIQKAGNAERIRAKKKAVSALKRAENRQKEVDRLFLKMYEDRASEKITERNFVMLSSKYQQEQVELEEQIESLREEIRKMEREMIGAEKWIDLIKENAVPKELTATLLNTMIEKILIHAPEIDENGERTQEIEIYYRFVGKID